MAGFNVMAVSINHRSQKATGLQGVLTKHGCIIKMRLGLHEAGNVCSEEGLVILQLDGSDDEIKALEVDLNSVEGLKAKTINL